MHYQILFWVYKAIFFQGGAAEVDIADITDKEAPD